MMANQTVTLNLPEAVYEQIVHAAERAHRPIQDILIDAVAAAAPVVDTPSETLRASLSQLAHVDDAALLEAARSAMTPEQRNRLEQLHSQQQESPLQPDERAEEQRLVDLYREIVLMRARAAVLLKERGYDISDPQQFAPPE